MKQANAIGLPTRIEWDLPEGCTISDVTWQDADEFALYEEIFAIEANVDASGLTTKNEGVIAVDVSYQRCNKKSGVCILENERVELPVTMKP